MTLIRLGTALLCFGCLCVTHVSAHIRTGGVFSNSAKVTTIAPRVDDILPRGDLCGMATFDCAAVEIGGNPTGGSTSPDTVLNVDLMTGGEDVVVLGIGWDVGIDSNSPSWRSEATVDFNGAVTLVPGLGDDVSGSATYASGVIEDLTMVDLDGDGTVDANLSFVATGGMLTLTLFESFDDAGVDPDGNYLANSTLTIEYMAPTECDFDGDSDCDIDDLNMMLAVGPIAGGVPAAGNEIFDLNSDGDIDNDDRSIWLATAGVENGFSSAYKLGDANLDGVVDGNDFLAWNAFKFDNSLQWDHGDFNGDGVVDGSDFLSWNANKFTSSDGISAVPEPSAMLSLLLVGLCGLIIRGRVV